MIKITKAGNNETAIVELRDARCRARLYRLSGTS